MENADVQYPQRSRNLHNMLMDTDRWDGFEYRDGDIIINTWAKSGTTWTQQIVTQLVFNGEEHLPAMDLAPWVELRLIPLDEMMEGLKAQTHRRFMKSHAPADTLDIQPQVKYLFLARDARDVIWSWYRHLHHHNELFYSSLNDLPNRVGPPLEKPSGTVREFFHQWMEEDGLYDWSYWDHIQSWWDLRHLPNVKLVHFNNLKADMPGEIRRMAEFLEIEIDEDRWDDIVEHCTFDYMKNNASALSEIFEQFFEGGLQNFVYKGTNKRWADTLTDDEIAQYEARQSEKLTPDCAHWHMTGEMKG